MKLVRQVKDGKKDFSNCIGSERNVKQIVSLLVSEAGELVTSDREKTEVLCLLVTKLVRGREAETNGFAQP